MRWRIGYRETKEEKKLEQAKEILKVLGLPQAQYNNRSAWVFLSLVNLKPQDPWSKAKAPLLPTVDIMQFIRDQYGQDYKPNSRETIRRQTLHQFEQARIVETGIGMTLHVLQIVKIITIH